MRLFLLLFLFTALPLAAREQTEREDSWDEYLIGLYEDDEEEAVSLEEAYEHLSVLAQQPLDINKVGTEELMAIPGLSADQISDIMEYRSKYGDMKSIDELNMIPSIDERLRDFLSAFVCVKGNESKRVTHNIIATAAIPTYYRAGDKESGSQKYQGTYLGDPLKHSVRYSLGIGESVTLNLTGAKSAGEPFFSNGNGWGYDSYAYNVSFADVGAFRKIIVGTFRAQFGMGLTMNNSFTLGKQAMLSSGGRMGSVFSPHNSASDSKHLQGIATTVDIGKAVLSAFFSYRKIDATLNKDSTIATILTDGNHRTATEMEKRNDAAQTTMGAHLQYAGKLGKRVGYGIGASALYTHLSIPLNPVFSTSGTITQGRMYRLYYPTGSNFWNAAVDYSLKYGALSLTGETAMCDKGELATVNLLQWGASRKVTMTAVQRFYSYKYTSLYGSAISEGGSVQNESGIYAGIKWQASAPMTFEFYTDYAYFPWMRYRTTAASHVWDNAATATYNVGKWALSARYRVKARDERTDHRLRFVATLNNRRWNARSQVEGCVIATDESSKGIILSQALGYKFGKRLQVNVSAAYFCTDDYDSRLYSYERGMPYSFGYASYYGRGLRAAMLVRYEPARWMKALLKIGHTRYFDRSSIGTAERQIFSNNQTDIELQIGFKL